METKMLLIVGGHLDPNLNEIYMKEAKQGVLGNILLNSQIYSLCVLILGGHANLSI